MEKRGYATCGNRPTPTAARGENSLAGSRAVYWDRAVVLLRLVALDLSLGQARPMAILLYYYYLCMQKLASSSSTPSSRVRLVLNQVNKSAKAILL